MKINKYESYIYAAFLVELLLFFFFRKKIDFILSPILFTCVGIFIALFPIFKFDFLTVSVSQNPRKLKVGFFFSLILICIVFALWANYIFIKNPIDLKNSDIIPYIDSFYVKRFLAAEFVYAKAPGLGYGNWTPNYLPMHWLPFVISKILTIDHRWIPFLFILFSILFYIKNLVLTTNDLRNICIKIILPFVVLFLIFLKQSDALATTVELLIAAYYFFLGVTLQHKSVLKKSIATTLTLLSRYVVIFYLPVAFLIEWFEGRKKLFLQIVLVFFAVLSIYVLPFLLQDSTIFIDGSLSYDIAALGEWKGQTWQNLGSDPWHLFQGLGFASWTYKFYHGDLISQIQFQKTALFLFSFLSLGVSFLFVIKFKNKINSGVLHLASLKLILTFVFAFSLVPYVYLFWTSIFISINVLSNYNLFAEKNKNVKNL